MTNIDKFLLLTNASLSELVSNLNQPNLVSEDESTEDNSKINVLFEKKNPPSILFTQESEPDNPPPDTPPPDDSSTSIGEIIGIVLAILLGIVLAYLGLARIFGWYPFDKKKI